MHIKPHPIRRRPIGTILEARRREKAALVARCRSLSMIAQALAHYRHDRGPVLTSADLRGQWEQLGDYAGVAASVDGAQLRTSPPWPRPTPEKEHPHERHGAPAQPRAAALAGAAP